MFKRLAKTGNNIIKIDNCLLQRRQTFNYSGGKQEYSNYYILRLSYVEDGYYVSCNFKFVSDSHRQQFRNQIKQLEGKQLCHIFGGDKFPMESSILVFNCDD